MRHWKQGVSFSRKRLANPHDHEPRVAFSTTSEAGKLMIPEYVRRALRRELAAAGIKVKEDGTYTR